jgi:pimeloyl-ACP methyl ester carboxylesterase
MGAATAVIFYGAYRDLIQGTIVGLILDSPFTSMQGLATEYSTTRVGVPSLLMTPAVHYLRHTIQATHQFDIYHINPLGAASRIDIPTVVLSGSEDKIVPPKLSEELYEAFNGPKIRIFFQGGHNTHRPAPIYEAIRIVVAGMFAFSCAPLSVSLSFYSQFPRNIERATNRRHHQHGDRSVEESIDRVPPAGLNLHPVYFSI